MARLQRVATRRSTHRPNRSWAGSHSAAFVTVAAATKVLLGAFSLSNPNIDETILRTVGIISVTSDQTAGSEQQVGAFGLIVVSDLAIAAGAASIPSPITDIQDDGWFAYVPFASQLLVASAVGWNNSVQYHFDSKAKRRIEEGTQVAIMVENAHATHAFIVGNVFRMLSQVSGT